jgi:hypothetical protein
MNVKYQQQTVYHINCKNFLFYFSLINHLSIQRVYSKVFNGIKSTHFNSMMCKNFVEYFLKLWRKLQKVIIGYKNFIQVLWSHILLVVNTHVQINKFSWISLYLLRINTMLLFTLLFKNV